jgi:hypothetical protein
MVRSAAALVAILILPVFIAAQEIPGTHTVVDGDTLWDLAQEFYGNPFDWRRIWNANQSQIEDPNLILPGQVFTIPDGQTSEVTEVVVVTPERPETPEPPARVSMASQRTVFYADTSLVQAGVVRGSELQHLAVPRDLVYSAPWLTRIEGDPENAGVIGGFAGGATPGGTVRSYDRVNLYVEGVAPRVGDRDQLFRVDRLLEDVGQVVIPTGIATVTDVFDDRAVAIVDKEYHRIGVGDFIGPLPSFPLVLGQYAQDVSGGTAAMVMGFARGSQLQDLNDIAFLDLGSGDGINLGDEFFLMNPDAGANVVEGKLQIVGVSAETSAARIVGMTDAVFRQGIVVRLAKKMR